MNLTTSPLHIKQMLVTHTGFVKKSAKIAKFVKAEKVAELRKLIESSIEKTKGKDYRNYTWEEQRSIERAEEYLDNFQPVELVYLQIYWDEQDNKESKALADQLTFLCARHSEGMMFECAYLHCSLGTKKYKYSDEMGLSDKDIQECQENWRKFGVDPTKAEFVDEEEETVVIPQI